MTERTIEIVVNGKRRDLQAGANIGDFIASLGLAPAQVIVERNGEPVGRDAFSATRLADGDTIEVAQMVGGG